MAWAGSEKNCPRRAWVAAAQAGKTTMRDEKQVGKGRAQAEFGLECVKSISELAEKAERAKDSEHAVCLEKSRGVRGAARGVGEHQERVCKCINARGFDCISGRGLALARGGGG